MTGDKVVRAAMAYEKDVQAIELQLALADDVALRITQQISGQGALGSGHSDKPLAVISRRDELTRARRAREFCYKLELAEAARLIGEIPWISCADVMRRTCFSGDSLRQVAASMKQSEDGVRSLRRRGWRALATMSSELGKNAEYLEKRGIYEEGMRIRRRDRL